MNLEKLLDAQRELLNRIITEKGLENRSLTKETFLALQVELAEFANEGRWFKYWSEDQKARTKNIVKCHSCNGKGYYSMPFGAHETCGYCDNTGIQEESNPLLEEYVDGFHLFLQVAILNKWEDALYIYEQQLDPDDFDGDLTAWQLEMLYFINKSYFEKPSDEQNEKWEKSFGFPESQYHFRTAWILFLNIGINGFKFTSEQIEQAYLDKNKINHARQENGY